MPPKVKDPEVVTVPVNVNPPYPPAPDTEVTVPVLLVLLLNVVQSAALNAPLFVAEAVGTFNVITGVVVPLATVDDKSVPVVPSVNAATLVTVPTLLVLLLNVVQSVELKYPFTEPLAAGIEIVPLELTKGLLNVKADCFAFQVAALAI